MPDHFLRPVGAAGLVSFIMSRLPSLGLGIVAAGLLLGGPAQAASLQQVPDWGASGVPSTVSMYIYVPDNLAPNPPILVVAHFCGGTAGAVFGQIQGGGIVAAADEHGFILLLPQTSNNCWDVGSTASLTHDGGGETHAVAQMVTYTINEYQANAERVYITGDSSGAMMTQAMLAVYPELFKGGSEFAGVPAGCWAVGNPDGSWSGQCADGMVTHTAEEWGDIARAMHPEYTGHRPRVQLFHGDADSTIRYANHTEAIKQWTNVLGLSTEPTSVDTVPLGNRQATRERWENSCGYVVLEALTSLGGDHGPSDAIFDGDHMIPFLALDNSDDVDPEIAACGESGAGGASGVAGSANGGSAGEVPAGGTNTGGIGGGSTAAGGGSAAGSGSGGDMMGAVAGSAPVGGMTNDGMVPAGGATSAPPATGNTGVMPTPAPSMTATSGAPGPAQAPSPSGSASSTGSDTPAVTPSSSGPGVASDASSEDAGCGCRTVGGGGSRGAAVSLALALLFFSRRRRGR